MSSNRRVERLITAARRKSRNTRYDTNKGIQDREVLELINDGLKHIFAKITKENTNLYTKEAFISVTAGTGTYTVPTRCYLGGKIIQIQYSQTGTWTSNSYYWNLNGPIEENAKSYYPGYPNDWLLSNGSLIISPIPSTTVANGIRIIYREEPPTLDIRRGVVAAATSYTPGTGILTNFTMNTALTPFDTNSYILDEDWVCIVDSNGNFLMRNVGQITGFTTSTGVISFDSAFRGSSTESAPAGAYITSGWNATTHSPYDKDIDDYLVDYAALYMLAADVDDLTYQGYKDKLGQKEEDLILGHSNLTLSEGFHHIPTIG